MSTYLVFFKNRGIPFPFKFYNLLDFRLEKKVFSSLSLNKLFKIKKSFETF